MSRRQGVTRRRWVRRALAALLLAGAAGCGGAGPRAERVRVVAAASLRATVEAIAERYRREAPGVDVEILTGGSNALVRRILEAELEADVVFLADRALFDTLTDAGWTRFHIPYAADRLVLAYTESSRGAGEIDADGWPATLLRPDVRVAIADPGQAPLGYRTLLALRLYDLEHPGADLEAAVRGKVAGHVRPDATELLAPLQTGAVDYAFLYGATAQSVGLEVLDLPAEIDLGDPTRADAYARVEVSVPGDVPGQAVTRRGAPILYGVSMPGSGEGRPAASAFLRLALSAEGAEILREHGLRPVAGAGATGS